MNERDYHDRHYATEAALFQTPIFRRVHARAARQFLRHTGARPQHRVLSLGCGAGLIERLLAPHVGEIVGLDISRVAIEQARAGTTAFANLRFELADGPIGRFGSFDIVAAFAFLHHLEERAIGETLRAARAVLRPGGLFYSSDPSRRRAVGLLTGLVRRTYERHHSPDERELAPEALAALAGEAGFARRAIGYTDYFLGPLAWLAPGTPARLAPALEALDNLALATPLARRYASSFYLCAS
jgi:SAM-dependent methyltransferase